MKPDVMYVFTFAHAPTLAFDHTLGYARRNKTTDGEVITMLYTAFFDEIPEGMQKDEAMSAVLFDHFMASYRDKQVGEDETIVRMLDNEFLPHVLQKCQELLDRTPKKAT